MKTIPLTRGFFTIVDDEDFEWASKYKWHVLFDGTKTYPRANSKIIGLMHRVIMDAPKDKHVDHVDHNTLNNTRKNLRLCTNSQNIANRRGRQKNNTSGYTGVFWSKNAKKWAAQIKFQNKAIHLGYFDDLEKAAKIRDAKAIELFGEFATLNDHS